MQDREGSKLGGLRGPPAHRLATRVVLGAVATGQRLGPVVSAAVRRSGEAGGNAAAFSPSRASWPLRSGAMWSDGVVPEGARVSVTGLGHAHCRTVWCSSRGREGCPVAPLRR